MYKNLEAEMARCGMNISSIADIIHSSRQRASRILSGQSKISIQEANMIVDAFKELGYKHTIEYLFDDEDFN